MVFSCIVSNYMEHLTTLKKVLIEIQLITSNFRRVQLRTAKVRPIMWAARRHYPEVASIMIAIKILSVSVQRLRSHEFYIYMYGTYYCNNIQTHTSCIIFNFRCMQNVCAPWWIFDGILLNASNASQGKKKTFKPSCSTCQFVQTHYHKHI